MIYTFGHTSGAHLNPAVTVAFAAIGEFPWKRVHGYVGAQVAGGAAASGLLRAMFGLADSLGATLPAGSAGQSLVLEFVLTFLLMMVIMGAAVDAKAVKGFGGLAIGAVVGLGTSLDLLGGPDSRGGGRCPGLSVWR